MLNQITQQRAPSVSSNLSQSVISQQAEFIKLKQKATPSFASSLSHCDSIEIDMDTEKEINCKQQENAENCEKEQQSQEPSNVEPMDTEFERNLYKKFQLKVLGILFINWSIACLFVVITCLSDSLQELMKNNTWILYVSVASLIAIIVILYCYNNQAKKVPNNYLFLFAFTLFISLILSYTCAQVSQTSLLIISGLFTLWITGLFIYSFKIKTDITYKASSIGYGAIIIIILAVGIASSRESLVQILIGLVIAGIFSFFLVYDLQKLRGKFHKSYEIDDYIIAAINIYIEVVVIFKIIVATASNN